MLRVGCHVRRARALAAGEGRAATDSVGSVRRVRGAPSAARGIAGGPPRWRRSCLYAQATLPGREIDVAGTSKGPEEAVGVPRPTRRWPTAMLRAGGAAVARLTRCHGRQTADSNGYGPFWGLSDLLYMVVSMCECVFASCCVVLSSYRSVPDSLSAKNRVLRRFPRGLGPNSRRDCAGACERF